MGLPACGSDGAPGDMGTAIAPQGATATLMWDALPDATVLGYRVYWGISSHNYQGRADVGPTTSYTLSNLESGRTYFFAVTAYNSGGESPFSPEVSAVPD